MSDVSRPTLPRGVLRRTLVPLGAVIALVAVGVGAQRAGWARYLGSLQISPHLPDLGLLAAQPVAIKLHLAAALLALGIGVVQMIGVKGTGLHRILGWTWIAAMATTAVSSLFIRELNRGSFSLIHLLSGWVIIALPMGIYFIRRGHVRMHAQFMTGLFVGGLLIAGLLAFIPGRLMWRLFFG